jgi:ABC-2 type transport system ATP-binding protein
VGQVANLPLIGFGRSGNLPPRNLAPAFMILHTEQLTKRYGAITALDRLDLDVRPGEIVGILGPNGSGKSTAIRLLLGYLRPTSGRASINGHDCWDDSVNARKYVSYLPGELRLYENMTGSQLIDFLSELRQHPRSDRVQQLARQFDIDIARPLAQMSSGMKRKIALMQVLLPETPLVILDEPTNTLDPSMRDQLLAQLAAARQRGQTVLFSSHVLTEVEQICDRVAILRQGQLVHWQRMSDLREIRRVRVNLGQALDGIALPTQTKVLVNDGRRLDFEHAGSLSDLLAWLAKLTVTDLKIEPTGLAGIYHQYHQANGVIDT